MSIMDISAEAIGPWKTNEKKKEKTRRYEGQEEREYRVGNDREKKSVWKLNTAG